MPTTTTSNATVVRRTAAKVLATYDYLDESGEVVGQVLRYDPKSFKQRRPKVGGGWEWKEPERKVPFHLPQLLAASAEEWIFIVEGEEDVLALESIGCVATCNLGGSARDVRPLSPFFSGTMVAVIPDNDEPGAKHAAKWEMALRGEAKEILTLPAFDFGPGSDPRDFVERGGTKQQLLDSVQELLELRKLRVSATRARSSDIVDAIESFLRRFVVYPSDHARVAHTLWIVHTHSMDLWESTPRLAFLSPEPASGKTRALEVTELLVPRPMLTINNSTMYMFRKVADPEGLPTILYDEVDTVFGDKAAGDEEIRALLNAGHRKGATAGRCVIVGKEVRTEEFPAYCAVAMAGIGDLPDTILSRSIKIGMHRRHNQEPVQPFRRRNVVHECVQMQQYIRGMMEDLHTSMDGYTPIFPKEVEDRDADVWEALFIIADSIGGTWPQRAREAAVYLVKKSKEVPLSLNLRLLKDIRLVFGDREKMSTQHILDELSTLEDAPWSEINRGKPMTTSELGRRMRKYDLGTTPLNVGGARIMRGYFRSDMQELWLRYLGSINPEPDEYIDPARAVLGAVTSVTSVTESPNGVDPDPPPY